MQQKIRIHKRDKNDNFKSINTNDTREIIKFLRKELKNGSRILVEKNFIAITEE